MNESERLHELLNELAGIEWLTSSKNLKLKKDWFLHPETVKKLRQIQSVLSVEVEKLEKTALHVEKLIEKIAELNHWLFLCLDSLTGKTDWKIEDSNLQERMPELISQIDVYLVEIIIKLQLYGEQPDSGKIRILLDLRLNIHGNPEVAAMLLQNWDIVREMKKIIDRYVKFSGNNFSHYY